MDKLLCDNVSSFFSAKIINVNEFKTLPSVPTGTSWERANDPCPAGWRMPTRDELQSLVNAGSIWTTRNGVSGRLFGTAPNHIFLSIIADDEFLERVGKYGLYWSSTQSGEEAEALMFRQQDVGVTNFFRDFGLSVRCVAE